MESYILGPGCRETAEPRIWPIVRPHPLIPWGHSSSTRYAEGLLSLIAAADEMNDCPVMGHFVETDLETGGRRCEAAERAVMRLTADRGRELLQVKRPITLTTYDVADVDGLYDATGDGRLALRFARPRRQLVVQADSTASAVGFLRSLRMAVKRLGGRLDQRYDPGIAQYVSVCEFDDCLPADIGSLLTSITLENVDATSINHKVGRLPLCYINLSGSKLDTTERTANWDWMTLDTVCSTLTVLILNSVGLMTLPYEIMFLKKLQTLSLAYNKLTHLPHFLGDLKELDCLFIDHNMLTYLPICLKERAFKHLNIFKNQFEKFVVERHTKKDKPHSSTKQPSKDPVSTNLFELALFSLIDSNIKFMRQNITLLIPHYLDKVYRCSDCNRLMVPNYNTELYESGYPTTVNLIRSNIISWQTFVCNNSKCISHVNYFRNLY